MAIQRVNVDELGRLPAFSHASIVGKQVFVAGTIGAAPGSLDLVPGGIGPETRQVLENIERVLNTCGCGLADVAIVHVYITDMDNFSAMNEAYVDVMGDDPPARITVGCAELAIGALVEMDCVAFIP
ncbi:MAG TPA: RidA family protein [Nocardioidaceae bacterium]|jgi:reactive intermediate/imine deaminase